MCLSIEDGCSRDDTDVASRQEEEFTLNGFYTLVRKCVCERIKEKKND